MTEATLNHPGDETLRALSLGQLTDAELAHVSTHLGECPECCRRIDELAIDDRLVARLKQDAASREDVLVNPAQRRSAVRALRRSPEVRSATRPRESNVVSVILPPPRQVGDYEILAEVGRGGMGVVYKAWHRRLHRLAALKMVLAGEFASSAQELRFRLEAELAARVLHPNIVQVYEIASYEGRPFLALEWVEGGSLANRLDGKPWPPGEAAALIETLATAINVAHGEGVVHRDLKPANILLIEKTRHDLPEEGPRSKGVVPRRPCSTALVPKITDFGLAQPIESGPAITQSGFFVGTPGYMAPEQAVGKRALVGPATDIYALGVILYQLLTGQLPFPGDSTLEQLRAVASDEPTRPRRLQPDLPRDLEAITLHCLEKEPRRRYPSALALAEDLQRFREGEPVLARPVGAVARLARASRRRPLVVVLMALLTVSLLGGLGGVTWKWLEADEQRKLAYAHARQAETEKQAALNQAYRACLAAANSALQNNDVADASRHLASAPVALRGWEWRHLSNRLDDSSLVIPLSAGDVGILLASPDRLRIGSMTDSGLRLTDLDGESPEVLPIRSGRGLDAFSASQTRQGLRVARWVGKTKFDLLDDAGYVLCRVHPTVTEPVPVVVSPDGTRLACATEDRGWKRITIFDATTGRPTGICDGHLDGLWSLCFSPDGTQLASCGEDETACVWDVATGSLLATCRGHTSKVLGVAFNPDGTRLVTTSSDGTVRQWDSESGREVEPPYDRHTREVVAATYSPDGQWIASAGDDRTIRVWRARGGQDVAVLQGHTGGVIAVAFAPDGRRLASLSRRSIFVTASDQTIRVWDVDPQASLPVLRGHTAGIYPVVYSPDGRWIASGSWDRTVRVWDAMTGEACATLPHPYYVWDSAFGPDGTWLMTGIHHEIPLRIYDVATGRVRKAISSPDLNFYSLTVSPDGTRVATTGVDSKSQKLRLTVFDTMSGKSLYWTEGASLSYSPDGRWLAALAGDEKTVLLLDGRTHETVARFRGHEARVHKAAFSPDNRRLATCSRDRTVRLWTLDPTLGNSRSRDAGEGRLGECRVLRGHSDEVYAVAFHPDGSRLASGGRDGAVWVWDVARGVDVVRLRGHESYIWSLAFSPDGATLASGSWDTTVRLWDTIPLKTRYHARRTIRALRTEAERLVDGLWHEKTDPSGVVDALRTDRTLSKPLRQAALRTVMSRMSPPESGAIRLQKIK